MSPDEQLLYESRVRSRQVAVAVAAGILVLVAAIVPLLGPQTSVSEATLGLIYVNKRFALSVIAAVVNGIAALATAWTLVFLVNCAKARKPDVWYWVRYVAWVGGVLSAVAGVAFQVWEGVQANTFVSTGAQTYDEANRLTGGTAASVLQFAALLSALLLAIAFVITSLQALRVGLLPRLLAYVGMFAGALVIIPVISIPIFQFYWLLAVAYLLSGRWPSGVPAAWRTGKAEALLSPAELRAGRVAAAGSRSSGRRGAAPEPVPAAEPAPAARTGNGATRSSTKRKRKRRR